MVVLCAGVLGAAGFFVLPRPHPAHRDTGSQIRIPDRQPAADAAGRAGWVWPEGVPGWTPGQMIKDYPVSGVQAVEVQAAQLAAARNGLDAQQVRVIEAMRGGKDGVLAILAAPTMFSTPAITCLAAVLRGNAPVEWLCPGRDGLANSHVLVAATRYPWAGDVHPTYLVGVARGDVDRVVLAGGVSPRQTLYLRGKTWGEFDTAQDTGPSARLLVYGHHRLLETVPLRVPVGGQRVLR